MNKRVVTEAGDRVRAERLVRGIPIVSSTAEFAIPPGEKFAAPGGLGYWRNRGMPGLSAKLTLRLSPRRNLRFRRRWFLPLGVALKRE